MRGYGGSTRPPQMDRPPSESEPFADTLTAVRDVEAAVDHIAARRGVAKISLMGWSWGTAIMGIYTTRHNDKVDRLCCTRRYGFSARVRPSAATGRSVPTKR
ncbi:MAG TPA: alpha/beta fold hydrolase [Xanthobacteraceae bacterium]|nr:alpha/beta fold hydrolase [Xanthobacteraceae bacterium]